MMDRMVDGNLQAEIVEAGILNGGCRTIFLQGLPDGRDRKKDHGPEVEIITNAPRLIVNQRMKDLPRVCFPSWKSE